MVFLSVSYCTNYFLKRKIVYPQCWLRFLQLLMKYMQNGSQKSWALKNWCFEIVVLEKTLMSPLNSKEIKPVNLEGNQPWTFTGRTYAEAEAPVLWPPDAKSRLIGNDPDTGKDWRQKKRVAEDGMVGCHHWLNGYDLEQTLGDGERLGSLCAAPLFASQQVRGKHLSGCLRNKSRRLTSFQVSSQMNILSTTKSINTYIFKRVPSALYPEVLKNDLAGS